LEIFADFHPFLFQISTTIVPKAGHGLNLEYSHPFTYKTINDFFASKVPAN